MRKGKVDRIDRFPGPISERDGIFPDDGYSREGVDLTLIRWMLSLTAEERLVVLQSYVQSVLELRNGSD